MWTTLHLLTVIPAFIVFGVAAYFIGLWLKDKSETIKLIPIQVIAAIITILEIIKQVRSIVMGYDLANLPLYYCSLFVFLYPTMALIKGKYKNHIRNLTLCSGVALLTLMIIMPDIIYGSSAIANFFNDFNDFHTVIFHNLVILGTFLIFSLNLYEINPNHDYLQVILFYFSFCVIVAPIANLTHVNFHNFYKNNLDAVEVIRQQWVANLGAFWGQTCYVLVATVLTVGLSVFIYFLLSKTIKLKKYFSNKRNKI